MGRRPGPRARRQAHFLSVLLGWRDGGWGARKGRPTMRPISSNGLTAAGRPDLGLGIGAALLHSDQLCVVLSTFESQKTSDLGLSRREVFKDVLGWSEFQKTDHRPKNPKTRDGPKNRDGRSPKAGNQLSAGSCHVPKFAPPKIPNLLVVKTDVDPNSLFPFPFVTPYRLDGPARSVSRLRSRGDTRTHT